MFDSALPELEDTALTLMSALLQHGKGEISEDELLTIYDELFDDLTIDDLQWLVLVFASLSLDVTSEWAQEKNVAVSDLLSKISLAKALRRFGGEDAI